MPTRRGNAPIQRARCSQNHCARADRGDLLRPQRPKIRQVPSDRPPLPATPDLHKRSPHRTLAPFRHHYLPALSGLQPVEPNPHAERSRLPLRPAIHDGPSTPRRRCSPDRSAPRPHRSARPTGPRRVAVSCPLTHTPDGREARSGLVPDHLTWMPWRLLDCHIATFFDKFRSCSRSHMIAGSVEVRRLQVIQTGNRLIAIGGSAEPRPKLGPCNRAMRRGTVAIRSLRATVASAARK